MYRGQPPTPEAALRPDKERLYGAFPQISPTGDFVKLEELEVILTSILTILATPKGSRVWAPDFGCNLLWYVYEPATATVLSSLTNDVTAALTHWENRVKYKDIRIEEVREYSEQLGYAVVRVIIVFEYQNRTYTAQFTFPQDINLLSGPIYDIKDKVLL